MCVCVYMYCMYVHNICMYIYMYIHPSNFRIKIYGRSCVSSKIPLSRKCIFNVFVLTIRIHIMSNDYNEQ